MKYSAAGAAERGRHFAGPVAEAGLARQTLQHQREI